jgi:hypothetical protein
VQQFVEALCCMPIPRGVIAVFHRHPSGRTMALGSTQPPREMSTRNTSIVDCLEIWEPEPPGTLRACPGLYTDCFIFFTVVKTPSFCSLTLSKYVQTVSRTP